MTPQDDQMQLVDQQQTFSPKLQYYLSDVWNMIAATSGMDYKIIAIFGSQSSGKSTLLNGLFGTDFAVMRDDIRTQTTRGIWLSKAKSAPFLILDVEGTDGRERGEDQDFERKSALFSLAIAQVLIINMFEHSVGLYNGANLGLLKTVFEVNLQLFQKRGSPKTVLLFVIRDYIGSTPLSNLEKTLRNDLNTLWSQLTKPESCEGSLFTDFFDADFVALPHKVLQKDAFRQEIQSISNRFYNADNPKYLFRQDVGKLVPIDGLYTYASNVWETIRTNRDLDLPSQKELVSQFRCDEVAADVTHKFMEKCKGFSGPIESQGRIPDDFKNTFQTLVNESKSLFLEAVCRYHPGIVQKKTAELLSKLHDVVKPTYHTLLKNLYKKSLQAFSVGLAKEQIDPTMEGSMEKSKKEKKEFSQITEELRRIVLEGFEKVAKGAILDGCFRKEGEEINEDADIWEYNEFLIELKEAIDVRIQQAKEQHVKLCLENVQENLLENLGVNLISIFDSASLPLWEPCFIVYQESVEQAINSLKIKVHGYKLSVVEKDKLQQSLIRFAFETAFLKKVREETSEHLLLGRLKKSFDRAGFRYDPSKGGLPRVWTPQDDLDGPFRISKEAASALLEAYIKLTIPADIPVPSPTKYVTILSEARLLKIREQLSREMEASYLETKRGLLVTTTSIPPWVLVLLLVLGWNEIMAVLSSPFYFLLLFLLGLTIYVLYALHLLPVVEAAFYKGLAQLQQNGLAGLKQLLSPEFSNPPTSRPPHTRE